MAGLSKQRRFTLELAQASHGTRMQSVDCPATSTERLSDLVRAEPGQTQFDNLALVRRELRKQRTNRGRALIADRGLFRRDRRIARKRGGVKREIGPSRAVRVDQCVVSDCKEP